MGMGKQIVKSTINGYYLYAVHFDLLEMLNASSGKRLTYSGHYHTAYHIVVTTLRWSNIIYNTGNVYID